MTNTSVSVKVEMEKSFCDIYFRVVEKATQLPLAGAEIEILTMGDDSINVYTTDAEGKLIFADMPAATQFQWACNVAGYKIMKGTVTTV